MPKTGRKTESGWRAEMLATIVSSPPARQAVLLPPVSATIVAATCFQQHLLPQPSKSTLPPHTRYRPPDLPLRSSLQSPALSTVRSRTQEDCDKPPRYKPAKTAARLQQEIR